MKIALVGSAPSSYRGAPYADPSWKIFGCSPGLYGVATRVDHWFELHLYEPGVPWFSPEYCQWLADLHKRGAVLWTGCADPDLPGYRPSPIEGGRVLPFKELLQKYDPDQWFCTSSLFWMAAVAIEEILSERARENRGPDPTIDKIGYWGVDMAANEEYEGQRTGIHYMTKICRDLGIEVGAPLESCLFTPRFRYGIDEWTHSYRKIRTRRSELMIRMQAAQTEHAAKMQEMSFIQGALDDLKYMGDTWATKNTHAGPVPLQPQPNGQ